VTLFDAHRVGKHELNYPEHEDGRHCLTAWEMIERGWKVNDQGRWFDPVRTEKARETFARAA
jgi:hypothetical protein